MIVPAQLAAVAGETALAFGTLIAIVNPVSSAFVFTTLTREMDRPTRSRLAGTASVTAAFVLLSFLFLGKPLLAFFGITLHAFRVAGGLYLGRVAFEMLSRRLRHSPEQYPEAGEDIAIIPLAIPLLSGPGSMASVMVMRDTYGLAAIALAIVLTAIVSLLVLLNAPRLVAALGRTGTNVVERLLGLLVLVIAVQFIFNGVGGWLEGILAARP